MTVERDIPGPLVADISNEVVRLVRAHFGKGPTQAKTVWHDDVIVTILRGGFTQAERTLYENGKGDVVEEGRRAMQDVFEREMRAAVERVTGRRVEAFLSANNYDPDISVEIFTLHPATLEDGLDGSIQAAAVNEGRLESSGGR